MTQTWLAMGGYGVYVWSAYGLTTVVLLLNLLVVRQRRKHFQQKLKTFLNRHDG